MRRVVVTSHQSKYPNPISFDAGDLVTVGRRDVEEYVGWIWTRTADGNEGWAPEALLEIAPDHTAHAQESYSARELDTQSGETIVVLRELNGWYWVRNALGQDGWIPAETTDSED